MNKLYTLLVWLPVFTQTWAATVSPVFLSNLKASKDHICPGGSVSISASVSGADAYQFQVKEGSQEWSDLPGASGNPSLSSGLVRLDIYDIDKPVFYRLIIRNTATQELRCSNELYVYPSQPLVSVNPQSLTQCNGANVEFKTAASSTGSTTYQWQISTDQGGGFSDLSITSKYPAVSSPALKVNGLANADHGNIYRCRITDGAGCLTYTANARLSVNQLSTTVQPTLSQQFCEGGKAEFFPAAVVGEVLNYQWSVRTSGTSAYTPLTASERFSGVDKDTLKVRGILMSENAYQLRVTFGNVLQGNGESLVTGTCFKTAARTSYVIHPRPLPPDPLPDVARCGPGKINVKSAQSYYWYDDTTATALSSGTTFQSPALTSSKPFYFSRKDARACESHKRTFQATVKPKPAFVVSGENTACPTDKQFRANITSIQASPDLISFYPGTPPLPGFIPLVNQPLKDASTVIDLPVEKTAGSYGLYVQLKNSGTGCVSDSLPFRLTIKKPTVILTPPSSQDVCEKEQVTLKVAASGEGNLSYQWLKDGKAILGANADTLILNPIENSNEGLYGCEVSGACGKARSEQARLRVLPLTRISSGPKPQKICAGNPAVFSLQASGTGILRYNWFKNGVPVGTDSPQLRLDKTKEADDQSLLWCEVRGDCGPVIFSDTVRLTVLALPEALRFSGTPGYCQGGTPEALSLDPLPGHQLVWYASADPGAAAAYVSPIISTVKVGEQHFFVSQRDSLGCESPRTKISIGISSPIKADLYSSTSALCATGHLNREGLLGARAIAEAETGEPVSYAWLKDGHLIAGQHDAELIIRESGLFKVNLKKGHCEAEGEFSIKALLPELDHVPNATDQEVCPGTPALLLASGNFTGGHFRWWNSETGKTYLSEQNPFKINQVEDSISYYVSYVKTAGFLTCESPRKKAVVSTKKAPRLELSLQKPSCAGQKDGKIIVLTPPGAPLYQYSLNEGPYQNKGEFKDLVAGTYLLNVRDHEGCISLRQVELISNPSPQILQQPESITRCAGNTVSFTIKGQDYNRISWQKKLPGGVFIPLPDTTATLRITGIGNAANPHMSQYKALLSNGTCTTSSEIVQLNVNARTGTLESQEVCSGARVTFSCPATTGTIQSYQWQKRVGSSGSFTDIQNGTGRDLVFEKTEATEHNNYFRCRLTFINPDQTSCTVTTDDARLSVYQPKATYTSTDVSCPGQKDGKIEIKVNGGKTPYLFSLNGATWQKEAMFTGLGKGSYRTLVKDAAGCETTDSVIIKEPEDFSIRLWHTLIKCDENGGAEAWVEVGDSSGKAYTYFWSNGSALPRVSGLSPGMYTVTVKNTNGCTRRDSVEIKVTDLVAPNIKIEKTAVCPGMDVLISASGCQDTVIWSDGQTGRVISIKTDKPLSLSARCKRENCLSAPGNLLQIKAEPILKPGEITSALSVQCAGYNPPEISNRVNPSGGKSYVVHWEINKSCTASDAGWEEIPGATSLFYNPPALFETSCFRRKVSDSCQYAVYSNPVRVEIRPDPVVKLVPSLTTLCKGDSLVLRAQHAGGAGQCTFSWQKNERSGSESSTFWETIAGSDSVVHLAGLQNTGLADKLIFFRVMYDCTLSSCNKATSPAAGVTLRAGGKFTSAFKDSTICSGNFVELKTEGCAGAIQWSGGERTAMIRVSPQTNSVYTANCTTACDQKTLDFTVRVKEGTPPPVNTTPEAVIRPAALSFSGIGQNLTWYTSANAPTGSATAPQHNEAGLYTYWLSQSDGTCESPRLKISAVIYPALSISKQPSDQVNCDGLLVSFQVAAVGAGKLTYEWQRKRPGETDFSVLDDQTEDIKSAHTALLKVYDSGGSENPHLSEYRCLVRDSVASITTEPGKLIVNSLKGALPNFKTCVGTPFSIDLKNNFQITGSVASYRWQYRYASNDEWQNVADTNGISGAKTAALKFDKMQSWFAPRYRCQVSFNTLGYACTENTDQTTLTIGEIPPALKNQVFEFCQFEKVSKPDIGLPKENDAIWYASQSAAKGWDKTPQISTNEHGDQHFFVSQVNNAGCESQRSEMIIRVHPEPSPPKNTTPAYVMEGQLLTFSAEGKLLKWFTSKTGKNFQNEPPGYRVVKTYKHFVSQTSAHGCESERTEISAEIRLGTGFSAHPKSQADCEGNSVTFSVKTKGEGEIRLQWQQKRAGDPGFKDLAGETSKDLKITEAGNALHPHLSQYRCLIRDSGNEIISDIATLTVNEIKSTMTDLQICEKQLIYLNPATTGEISMVEWQRREASTYKTVFKSEGLRLSDTLLLTDQGDYRLKINFKTEGKNTCSRNTNVFKLKVRAVPRALSKSDIAICQYQKPERVIPSDTRWYDHLSDTLQGRILPFSNTAQVTKQTFYAAVINEWSCESERVPVSIVIKPAPKSPEIDTLINYCQFSENEGPSSTSDLVWYGTDTGPKHSPFIPLTQNTGTFYYGVSVKDTNGCESPRRRVEVNVQPCYYALNNNDDCLEFNLKAVKGHDWYFFRNGEAKIVAAIHPEGNDLGDLTLNFSSTGNALVSQGGTNYLPRYFHISSTSGSSLKTLFRMKVYVQEKELFDYGLENPEKMKPLSVVNYTGINEDCRLLNNDNFEKGSSWVLPEPAKAQKVNDDFYAFEFQPSQSGEFGLTENTFSEAEMKGFHGANQKPVLTWTNLKEKRTLEYVIYKSDSALEWFKSAEIPASRTDYSYTDNLPFAKETFYRLLFTDVDGTRKWLKPVKVTHPEEKPACFVFPNPVVSEGEIKLYLNNFQVQQVRISDAGGRELAVKSLEPLHSYVQVATQQAIAPGVYFMTALDKAGKSCVSRFVR